MQPQTFVQQETYLEAAKRVHEKIIVLLSYVDRRHSCGGRSFPFHLGHSGTHRTCRESAAQ